MLQEHIFIGKASSVNDINLLTPYCTFRKTYLVPTLSYILTTRVCWRHSYARRPPTQISRLSSVTIGYVILS